jgi:hypothetical protein
MILYRLAAWRSLLLEIGFQWRSHENLAIAVTQCEHLMLPDGTNCHFLRTAQNELRQRTAGKIRRTLEQDSLFVREPGLQPSGFRGDVSSFAKGGVGPSRSPFIERHNTRVAEVPYFLGLYAMQSISTFILGSANFASTVVRAGLASPKNCA